MKVKLTRGLFGFAVRVGGVTYTYFDSVRESIDAHLDTETGVIELVKNGQASITTTANLQYAEMEERYFNDAKKSSNRNTKKSSGASKESKAE